MKKLLTLALALVTLAVFSGLGVAQQKAEEEKPPAVPAPRTYAPGDAHYGSTPKKEISGIESETPVKAKPPVGVEMKQPATGEKAVDKASAKLITGKLTGKVTGVDPTAKAFTVMVQGRAITFSAAELSTLPTVGEIVDITFTLKPDELPLATSTARPGSTADSTLRPVGGYCHCNSHSSVRPPLKSLNVCKC
jgi:hypothetical protein